MRNGKFILNRDFYDVPFRDRDTWHSLSPDNFYANEFVVNMVKEFYRDWYYITNIDWWFSANHMGRRFELIVIFNYEPEIKPHIAECIEYMIEQLAA